MSHSPQSLADVLERDYFPTTSSLGKNLYLSYDEWRMVIDALRAQRAEVESLEGELWNEARSLGADIIERLDGVCSSDYVAGEVYEAMRKCMNSKP